MMEEIKPLYTTVETEWLETLLETKKVADGTSTLPNLKMVVESLQKARKKHPHFADIVTRIQPVTCAFSLEKTRHENDVGEKEGNQCATDILFEEIYEAVEAYLDGDMDAYRQELADTIAVCFRMMELK